MNVASRAKTRVCNGEVRITAPISSAILRVTASGLCPFVVTNSQALRSTSARKRSSRTRRSSDLR